MNSFDQHGLARAVKLKRGRDQMSQHELAQKLGIGQASISRLERGAWDTMPISKALTVIEWLGHDLHRYFHNGDAPFVEACPFCGAVPGGSQIPKGVLHAGTEEGWAIACDHCYARGPLVGTSKRPGAALDVWNTRQDDEDT